MRYVVILAGGSGTRLWPLSRQGMPKQLLRLIDGTSLLRLAYERVAGFVPDERILVCTGAAYADTVAAELPELPSANVLGEPVGRDSLNAVAWPAAVLAAHDPDAVVAMVTADQIITPVEAFVTALDTAFSVAEADASALVTFGVVPTTPHTGYGYLHVGDAVAGHAGVHEVVEFREKPDAATAQRYLAAGNYWWNAGMFVWRAQTLLDQLDALEPATAEAVRQLAAHPEDLAGIYPRLPKNSIDYAVMEPVSQGRGSAHVVTVKLPISWHDVGGFTSLAEQFTRDEDGNARRGVIVALDSANNLLISTLGERGLLAVLGVRDMVVVQTPDITLVCPLADAERIKMLVAAVAEQAGAAFA